MEMSDENVMGYCNKREGVRSKSGMKKTWIATLRSQWRRGWIPDQVGNDRWSEIATVRITETRNDGEGRVGGWQDLFDSV